MTDRNNERALALIDEYLGADVPKDYRGDAGLETAWKLGTAQSMLRHLLELGDSPQPATMRNLFERWRQKRKPKLKAVP